MQKVLVAQLCLTVTLWTVACQTPLSMGFPWQEYSSGLPFPTPDLLKICSDCSCETGIALRPFKFWTCL